VRTVLIAIGARTECEAVTRRRNEWHILVLTCLGNGQGQLTTPTIRAADRAAGRPFRTGICVEQRVRLTTHTAEPEAVCLTAVFTDAGLSDATLLVARAGTLTQATDVRLTTDDEVELFLPEVELGVEVKFLDFARAGESLRALRVVLVDADSVDTTGVALLLGASRLTEEALLSELLEVPLLVKTRSIRIVLTARDAKTLEGAARSTDSSVGVCFRVGGGERITGGLTSDRALALTTATCARAIHVRVTDLTERASLTLKVDECLADAAPVITEEAVGAVTIVLTGAARAGITNATAVTFIIGGTREGAKTSYTAGSLNRRTISIRSARWQRSTSTPTEA
jgi:hypothetical protein